MVSYYETLVSVSEYISTDEELSVDCVSLLVSTSEVVSVNRRLSTVLLVLVSVSCSGVAWFSLLLALKFDEPSSEVSLLFSSTGGSLDSPASVSVVFSVEPCEEFTVDSASLLIISCSSTLEGSSSGSTTTFLYEMTKSFVSASVSIFKFSISI